MKRLTRCCRSFVLLGLCLATTATAAGADDRPLVVVTDAARAVHAASFVLDGHNDLPWAIRTEFAGAFEKFDLRRGEAKFHTDIPRLRKGNVGAQFWAAYVPAETSKEPGKAFAMTLEQIAIIREIVKRYPETFEFATTTDDVARIRQSGKIASLIGVEGGHSIEDSLENLRRLYDLGGAVHDAHSWGHVEVGGLGDGRRDA